MSNVNLLIALPTALASPIATGASQQTARQISSLFNAAPQGVIGAMTVRTGNAAVAATGTVTYESATGTLTTTINGVGVTADAGVDDTASAVAMAAAINASGNALVNKHVTATSAAGVVTITAIVPGYAGNAVTLAASAGGGTATASGARLTGGTETVETFSFA